MVQTVQRQSVIWSQDFSPGFMTKLFKLADGYKKRPRNQLLRGKRIIMLFHEESTRTRFSFEAAVDDMGGSRISTENAKQFSSFAKGESFEHSIRVLSAYGDAIVLRHSDDNAAMLARDTLQSQGISVPIINAGCGGIKGQHPTQSLLDLYTIKQEIGRTKNLRVVMVGDLMRGRTVRSLAYLLGKYAGNQIDFVAPPELAMGDDILAYLRRHNVPFTQGANLADVIKKADVVYVTRIQRERPLANGEKVEVDTSPYRLTVDLAQTMRPLARIMHPLPIVDEIETAVDRLPQAAYFRQSDNGVPVRKALLHMMFAK